MAKRQGRGRLSSIDLLPEECGEAVSWALQQLQDRSRTQEDIYGEFRIKLIALQGELGLPFDIPSRSSFSRRSVKLADLTRRLEETRIMAAEIAPRLSADSSDQLTIMIAETIKTVMFEALSNRGEDGIDPKGIMEMARALQSTVAALKTSSERVKAVDKIKSQVGQALDAVEGAIESKSQNGAEVLRKIREDVYGIFDRKGDGQ